jgi:redox-sensitive bicupin YhaK (pirin superfamily)
VLVGRRSLLLHAGAAAGSALIGCDEASPAPVRAKPTGPSILVHAERRVAFALRGMPTTDGAGVRLLRVIGQPALRHLDPFILLDRIFSDDPSAYIRGFPSHPHRGFETVSVMLDGKIRHRDSRGNQGLITGGGAQWMTAGRGIVHSEMPEQEQGLVHGFQLWVNLPAREKFCPQVYQDLSPDRLAEAKLSPSGSVARVIAGSVDGLAGPVRPRPTAPTLMTLSLEDERPFLLEVPQGHTAFAFVHTGRASIGPEGAPSDVGAGTLAVLGEGNRIRIRAAGERAGLVVAAAQALHEPIVQSGPFVMNTEEEIAKAWEDYRDGVLDRG